MLVRATKLGISSEGRRVRPGDVFEHAGPLGSWMEAVGEPQPSPAPSEEPPAQIETSEAAEQPAEAKPSKRRKGAE